MAGTDPETVLVVTIPESAWSQVGADVTWTNIDTTHGNKFTFDACAILIVTNTGGSTHSFAVSSQPDLSTGRYGDINESITAGEYRVFQFQARGWKDELGYIVIPAGQSASLKVAIIAVPSVTQ
jgi:hypothetical protein